MYEIMRDGPDADLAYRRERLHEEFVRSRLRREARQAAKAAGVHHRGWSTARQWVLRGSGAWHVAR